MLSTLFESAASSLSLEYKEGKQGNWLTHGGSTVVTSWKLFPSYSKNRILLIRQFGIYHKVSKMQTRFSVTSHIRAQRKAGGLFVDDSHFFI